MAPEIFRNEKYDEAVDIYSLGIMFNEMLGRETPYASLVKRGVLSVHNLIAEVARGRRPEVARSAPQRMQVRGHAAGLRAAPRVAWLGGPSSCRWRSDPDDARLLLRR